MKKAFQITLIVGLALLGFATLLPAISIAGESSGVYGTLISNDWLGGAVLYLVALPFVGLLALNSNKKFATAGRCLGIGLAAFNLYTFALTVAEVKRIKEMPGDTKVVLSAGPIFALIGAVAVLAIILVEIFLEIFGNKIIKKTELAKESTSKDLSNENKIHKTEVEEELDLENPPTESE